MRPANSFLLLLLTSLTVFSAFLLLLHLTPTPSLSPSSPSPGPPLTQKTSLFGQLLSQIKPPPPVKIAIAGDVLLARSVASQAKKQNDLNYPFLQIAPYLQSADIAFFNLESPIVSIPGEVPINSTIFHIEPEFVPILAQSGVDIVSLANNHTPDQNAIGIKNTIETLSFNHIKTVGAGPLAQAHQLQIFPINDLKIGFLAYTNPALVPKSYTATHTHPGTAMMDIAQMTQDIQNATPQVDWLFVSLHFGNEYSQKPSQKQIQFAHAAIDAGADFVIGHHPHVLQPIEQYKNSIIFYSLGNFIFDQPFSLATRQSVLITLKLDKDKINHLQILPLMIDNLSQPRPASPQESTPILNVLQVSPNHPLFSIQNP